MICKKCDALLDLYERAVRIYANAVRNLSGMLPDDFYLAFERAERLKEASHEASEDLMMHWRQEHSHLAISTED